MVVEWLNTLFIPDFESDRKDIYSPVWKWEIYENNGVYSVLTRDAIVKYYFVDSIYNFGLRFLFDLFRTKLRAHRDSRLAVELINMLKAQLQKEIIDQSVKI